MGSIDIHTQITSAKNYRVGDYNEIVEIVAEGLWTLDEGRAQLTSFL